MHARVLAEDEMRCDLWRRGSISDEHAAAPSQRADRSSEVSALSGPCLEAEGEYVTTKLCRAISRLRIAVANASRLAIGRSSKVSYVGAGEYIASRLLYARCESNLWLGSCSHNG